MKNKITNNRPLLFLAISIILGIFISLLSFQNSIAFGCIASGVFIVSIVIFFSLKKKIIILLCFGFIVGFLGFYLQYISTVEKFSSDLDCYIVAKVDKINRYDTYQNITLNNLKIDGKKTKGKAEMTLNLENEFSEFDEIKFYGKVNTKEISIEDKNSLYDYGKGIFYDIEFTLIKEKVKDYTFFEKLKYRMILPMDEFLSPENKGVAVSLLFGDISYLNESDHESISTNGINHIFAVSGLHISFVVLMLAFLIKKLRMNKWVGLLLTSALLFIYCGITKFPPSAIRASIMAVMILLSIAIYEKIDLLSSLSFACVVMLLFCPRMLFSLSFIMSVCAVLGITLFFKPLYRFFKGKSKNSPRKFVASSVSLSLSANSMLLPVCINTFGRFSLYFVLANLLILPIITILYSLLFVTSMLCIITYQCGFIYLVSNIFIEAVRVVSVFLSNLPMATINTNSLGVFSVIYILIMIILSRFILVDKQKKLYAIVSLLGIGMFLFILI